MKTITGKITSTKPISLSKASKILSKFISTDNCASSAVRVYLSRASESFNELTQLHKSKCKSKSDQKRIQKSELSVGESRDGNAGNLRENGGGFGEVREREKDEKNGGEDKSVRFGENGGVFVELGSGVDGELSRRSGGKKDNERDHVVVDGSCNGLGKKKENKEGLGGVGVDGSGEDSFRKKKKKKKDKKGWSGVKDGVKLDEGLGKNDKRKGKEGSGRVVDNVGVDGSGEGSGKKHKKKKKDKEGSSGVVSAGSGVNGDVDEDGSGKKKKVSQDVERMGSKKRKVEEVEEGGDFDGSEERRRKKKRKSKQTD